MPLNKFRCFRDVLQENAFRLTDRSHMANLIPFMWKEEQQLIKTEIQGRELSVVFDGTTRLGEAVVILVRYVTEHMEIQQRLLRVQMVVKSMTGDELARELISVLSINYSVSPNTLLALSLIHI